MSDHSKESSFANRWLRQICAVESTRKAGLMRIALACIVWSTWGIPFIHHFDLHWTHVLASLAFALSSLGFAVGLATKFSASVLAATLFATIFMAGESEAHTIWTLERRTLTATLTALMVSSSSGRSLAVDRWLEVRRSRATQAAPRPEYAPSWGMFNIRCFATVSMASTAFWQMTPAWRSGRYIDLTFLDGDMAKLTHAASLEGLSVWLAHALLVTHIYLSVAPWIDRLRPSALWLGSIVYLILFTVAPLHTVPLAVAWMLCAFIPANQVHQVIDQLHGHRAVPSSATSDGQ